VLRDIPLPATELDVCRAVYAWAFAYFGADLDGPASDELPDSDPASDDLLIMPTKEDRRILQYIDLSCIKASDIRTVCFVGSNLQKTPETLIRNPFHVSLLLNNVTACSIDATSLTQNVLICRPLSR
jgi:hypothetical protein